MRQGIESIILEARNGLTDPRRAKLTVDLVKFLLVEGEKEETNSEKKERELLGKIMKNPRSKAFTTSFLDQAFRSHRDRRVMKQFTSLLDTYGIPKAFNLTQKLALIFTRKIGPFFPTFFIPFVKDMVRVAAERVIISDEKENLSKYLEKRKKEGIDVNINHLGEAILGESEALRRLNTYIEDLKNPEISCVSVKISTLYSQIDLIARVETLSILEDRLRLLFRAAKDHFFNDRDGKKRTKFVNLDMEEFQHLDLTVEAFLKVLEEDEFLYSSYGIALQSYLPDSFNVQKQVTAFAQERVRKGGAPLKIRLVKGANLGMEKVEASIKNIPQAPYLTKLETDANFLRMFNYGVEHAQAVYVGVGSHNLFDVAYAMLVREEKGLHREIGFEMLEGMAPSMARLIHRLTDSMLLYSPTASKSDFHNAIAYLMRRLDENTSPENFLNSFFTITPDSSSFKEEERRFLNSLEKSTNIDSTSRRGKPRANSLDFSNEPDSDWVLKPVQELIHGTYQDWKNKKGWQIPLMIGGEAIPDYPKKMFGNDPSDPNFVRYTYALATQELAHLSVETAKRAFDKLKESDVENRAELLVRTAENLRKRRYDLIGVMMADGGKIPSEADYEVSEAIDFCLYYKKKILEIFSTEDIAWEPKGVVVVLPPWNFPCSIPVGCIAAALAAGNSVIFKPAPQTVWVGYEVVKCFWDAGVPKEVLQFITGDDIDVGSTLVKHPDTSLVCLTGSNDTAKIIYDINPGLDIIAETGGKNTMIVTALADRDLAIRDIIRSAFSHSGQKCSALSLLILENEVYKDPSFFRQLHDAAKSLAVGSAFDPRTKINPLISDAEGKLLRGLTTLEPGEEWLLKPKKDAVNSHLWSPGIKIGVQEGSFTHQTELFGPVLGVMRAKNLDHAIQLANGTPYGLTAGLHTLDKKEQEIWFQRIKAGNCYINRGITGAIVERQPFGGTKESTFGRGLKAGGPNYLTQFIRGKQIDLPKEGEKPRSMLRPFLHFVLEHQLQGVEKIQFKKSVENYEHTWKNIFSKSIDVQKLIGQDNLFSYRPHRLVICRMEPGISTLDFYRVIAACLICDTPLEISLPKEIYTILPNQAALKGCTIYIEEHGEFLERFSKGFKQRLRLLSKIRQPLKLATAKTLATVIDDPVLSNGRYELIHYLREVALSDDYHRYGYLGAREREGRNAESGFSSGRDRSTQ